MAQININKELNGIEIIFEGKPDAATLDALKANGYRWHRVKKLWYAKNTAERLALAESLADGQQIPAPVKESTPAPVYNLENLGANKPNCYGGAELSKAIREELKRRGVKNCTVKVSNYDHIFITWKASADDFASLEEAANRCNIWDLFRYSRVYKDGREIYETEYNEMTDEEKTAALRETVSRDINRFCNVYAGTWHEPRNDRDYYNELSAKGYKTLSAIIAIGNQWNYDNSDSMTDYFDVGYILDVDVVKPDNFEIREEMTDAERKAYEEEQAEKEAKEAAELEAWKAEQKAREEARAKYDAWRTSAETAIYNDITVEDIPEENQPYITGLAGGIGKESTLDELRETIAERIAEPEDAAISRKVIFKTESVFADFCKLFLDDFTFLEGKGGTASDDIRLKDFEMYNRLTTEQRETIKFYNSDCIAVYVGDALRLVINPQGYSYARYVYIPTETTEIRNATEESAKQTSESEEKPAFYIPAPVEEQAEAIKPGESITIYQCDGWIINNIYAGAGTVEEVTAGNYAQYSGIYVTLSDRKKSRRVFLRNGKECLIYRGILPELPEEVTSRRISANMREMFNYNKLLPNTYNYYLSQGITPILDTCPR